MDEQTTYCKYFRTKAYYTVGCHIDPADCASPPATWCMHTSMILGPDDNLCSFDRCQPGRSCFREEPTATA